MNKLIRTITQRLLQRPAIESQLRGLHHKLMQCRTPQGEVGEARPITCCPSAFRAPRLNLVIPSLARRHLFGGISTALNFAEALQGQCPDLRLVLTEQHAFHPTDNPDYADWPTAPADGEDQGGRRIVAVGDRLGTCLPVGPGDRFIATAWWTAFAVRRIQQWQMQHYQWPQIPRALYLIQDFEPGFYPWSARYALAESTYHDNARMIAVFNSSCLKNYFDEEGYRFERSYTFEPVLNTSLRKYLQHHRRAPKERRILVYGRPSVERNAFELIVMGLREWVARQGCAGWTFISAGENHPPVDLGHGRRLTSLGKLDLAQYAQELDRASLGLSLMISPHPSYPPLEMAAFGLRVLTNSYKGKDLSTLAPGITSLNRLDPDTIARALDSMAGQCQSPVPRPLRSNPQWDAYLRGEHSFHSIVDPVIDALFEDRAGELSG
jgi:hypothetical protein